MEEYDSVIYKAVFTKPWIVHLQYLLLNHVITEVKAADVENEALYETAAPGSSVGAYVGEKVCFVPALAEEGGCVVVADVMAKNGIAHVSRRNLLLSRTRASPF